jgi:hypothetical protein
MNLNCDTALSLGLGTLPLLSNSVSRSISPENPNGRPGGGGRATSGTGLSAARDLGRGWKISPSYMIPAGEVLTLADIEGPGAIQSVWFGGNVSKNLVLRIYWDGQSNPSVECPITDFFAYGWARAKSNSFKGPFYQVTSLPVAVNPNKGCNCFWTMPFQKHCLVTLENRMDVDYACYYQINYALGDVPENSSYFHAQYRQTFPMTAGKDHTILDGVSGRGSYVGTVLSVGLNGAGNWWGEGELKFFLDDDEEFPTICNTGTEDYFGGSYDWEVDGKYVPYSTPYMGMHLVEEQGSPYHHQQRFSLYRWHIMDPIRFRSRFRLTIQDLGWMVLGKKYLQRRDDIASVAFWYQTLPTAPFPKFPAPDELEVWGD